MPTRSGGLHPGGSTIAAARWGQVLNSHLEWTTECEVRLSDGRAGRGSAPRGETPSIFEHSHSQTAVPRAAIDPYELVGLSADQAVVDATLIQRIDTLGSSNVYAASVALFEALRGNGAGARPAPSPRILFNLLNGGLHAYTNPVRADITEVLLASRTDDLVASIEGYRRMMAAARASLADRATMVLNGNEVHDLGADGDDGMLGLATRILEQEGLQEMFGLAVDASAGDWWDSDRYRLPVSDRTLGVDELVERWLELLGRYDLWLLEDPFAETDFRGWEILRAERPEDRLILADNFTSTRPDELEAKQELIDGVLIKPDQNGTISGTSAFARRATEHGLVRVVSHRSIETDSPFIVHLSSDIGAEWVKIGPFSDFSAVMRTNELLRTAG